MPAGTLAAGGSDSPGVLALPGTRRPPDPRRATPSRACLPACRSLLASLSHPNIISYYEAFCDHNKLCVVTELVNGGDLGSFIA